jgi:hypothetical protein
MALLQCPECSNEVSDKAVACPKCGYPLQAAAAPAGSGSGGADAEIRGMLALGNKIAAIKLYRELHPGMGLAEAKEAIDALERRDATTAAGDPSNRPSPTQKQGLSPGALLALVVVLVVIIVVIWRMVFSRG